MGTTGLISGRWWERAVTGCDTCGRLKGLEGATSRLQVDCYCILANADWVLVGFDASPHPAKKHPANSTSPARQRHLRQPTTTTKLLLQNLQILSSSLQLKTISSLIRNKFSVGRPLLAASCNFMLRWLMSAAKAKPHSSVTKMKDMLCSPSNSLSSVICFVDSLYRWS